MKKLLMSICVVSCLLFVPLLTHAGPGEIATIAGGGVGDGGPATGALLLWPVSAATDTSGNVYIADAGTNRIRKVDTGGNITTVAGTGSAGYNGDGIAAVSARLNYPTDVAVDTAGNVYIADTYNNRIRKVDTSGTITTVAGTGTSGYDGDGLEAISTRLFWPYGVAVDTSGKIYIVDQYNQRIRKVDGGTINTIAGTGTAGYSGDGAAATSAEINYPTDVAVDTSGNVYIADVENQCIRMVNAADGKISTIAGIGTAGYNGDDITATTAKLSSPYGIFVDTSRNLYIADSYNGRIRKVNIADGIISTVVGTGVWGYSGDGNAAASAQLNTPNGITLDASGNMYIADLRNYRIRKVDSGGTITTFVGGQIADNVPATAAVLNSPYSAVTDSRGNLYIADSENHRIRKVDTDGNATTVAGTGTPGYNGDDIAAVSAQLNRPFGVAVDESGNIYIADSYNNRIRKVDTSGDITTVAGTGAWGYYGDGGPAVDAKLANPSGVFADTSGNLYIADTGKHRIRKVDTGGTITTVAGTGTGGYTSDGIAATDSQINRPSAVAVDTLGNIYIADTNNSRVRKVDTGGFITTVAGTGNWGYTPGYGGAAASANLNGPSGIAVDASGNIYIADTSNHRIRKVDSGGFITTVAGSGAGGYNGDGIAAVSAQLNNPRGVSVDASGNIYIADTSNLRIRKVTESVPPTVVSVTPAENATGLAVNTAVTAIFSEAMDGSTIDENSFYLNGVNGSVGYDAATKTATFTPSSGLVTSTTFTAIVTTGVKDLGGNPLSMDKTWNFTTIDIAPDAFAFADQSGAALDTIITSNTVTVAGIEAPAAISVTGGEYRVNGGAWTSVSGTVNNGALVTVRHTSSANNSTAVNTVLTIGGVSDTFTSTTLAPPADETPDAFSFAERTDEALSSIVTSETVTISGINTAASISVTGGEYRVNGDVWTSVSGTVNNGDTVTVRHTSSSNFSTTVNSVVTIGGRAVTFTSTTAAADTAPEAFAFTDQTGATLGALITSNTVTVAGINTAAAISVTGGEYRVNGVVWTSSTGTVNNGDTVTVRHTSSPGFSTTVNSVLMIGGVSDTFSSTTLAADTTPEAFVFPDQTGVALGALITSNTVTVAGINTASEISVTNGEYRVNNEAWTAAVGTVNNGDVVTIQHISAPGHVTAATTFLTIGGVSASFTSWTLAADTVPDAFVFTDQTGVAVNTLVTSNTVTVWGINSSTTISITGGAYKINTSSYTTAAGTVNNGDTVTVRLTSSSSFSTAENAVLTIGGVSDTFTGTTLAEDTTPEAFAFTDQADVALGTVITSNTVTISGINAAASISITGGEYKINSGSYTSAVGTVNNGDTVTVRLTSSSSFSTAVNTVLTIGGVSDTFTGTTLAEDTTPEAFTFTDQIDVALSTVITSDAITVAGINAPSAITITGGEYKINSESFTSAAGTVNNGDTVTVRHTSSSSFLTAANSTLTIGGVSETFTSTTLAEDATPDAFTFTDQTGAPLNTVITSNAVTVSGINAASVITITNGEYKLNGGSYTSAAGTVNNGDTVTVRHTSSANFSTTVNTSVTIGGVSDIFASTTLAIDIIPEAFTFTDQTEVTLSTVITSNAVTVSGINAPSAITIADGEYRINNGSYTSAAGTVNNGATVTVRHTSSASYATAVNTVLTIGGVSDTFTSTSTTLAEDTTPAAFTFTDQTGAPLSTVITSNAIIVSGINAAASISITGGEYKINSGSYTAAAGTVNNGDTVTVRHTSSAGYSTSVSTSLMIGGVTEIFKSTTLAEDTAPAAFTFTDQTGMPLSTVIISNVITVSGINAASAITIAGGEYRINSGSYTTAAGTVNNGDTVTVRHTSSASYSTAVNTVLTIGGVSDTFTSTSATLAADTTPAAFTFAGQAGVELSAVITSNAIIVSGINAAASISITGGEYKINSGGYTSAAGTVNNGDTVMVRHTSSSSHSAAVNTVLTIGGVSGVFTSTTSSAPPVNTAPDGDLDGYGVSMTDALKALRIAAGLDTATSSELQIGDVAPLVSGVPASDGKIDIGDVVVILRKAVGLVSW